MSEQYQDSQENLISETRSLGTNTRLLWSGISTTNKKLEANVKALVELTAMTNKLIWVLKVSIQRLTITLSSGIRALIKAMSYAGGGADAQFKNIFDKFGEDAKKIADKSNEVIKAILER